VSDSPAGAAAEMHSGSVDVGLPFGHFDGSPVAIADGELPFGHAPDSRTTSSELPFGHAEAGESVGGVGDFPRPRRLSRLVTQHMWNEASVEPRLPLTHKQRKNKHVLRDGVVRRSAKDTTSLSSWRVARLHIIHALQLPAAQLIGRVMPSGDSVSRPYTVTDLGYDYNSGHLQFNHDEVLEDEPRAYVMLRGDAPSDIHSVVKWVDERTGDDYLHLVNVLSPEEVEKHGVLTQ
jgi:hypothetical protein